MSRVTLLAYEFEIIGGLTTEIHTEVQVFGRQYAFGDDGQYERSAGVVPSHYTLYDSFGKLA